MIKSPQKNVADLITRGGEVIWGVEPDLGVAISWSPVGRASSYATDGPQHSFMEIDIEIFSMVILSLPPIQEGQLSVSEESALYWLIA